MRICLPSIAATTLGNCHLFQNSSAFFLKISSVGLGINIDNKCFFMVLSEFFIIMLI